MIYGLRELAGIGLGIKGDVDPTSSHVRDDNYEGTLGPGTAPSATVDGLARSPVLDLRAKPEFHATLAEVDYRAGHVGVAVLVDAHRVVARDAKDLGDAVSIDEVVEDNGPRHALQITSVLGSVRGPM